MNELKLVLLWGSRVIGSLFFTDTSQAVSKCFWRCFVLGKDFTTENIWNCPAVSVGLSERNKKGAAEFNRTAPLSYSMLVCDCLQVIFSKFLVR